MNLSHFFILLSVCCIIPFANSASVSSSRSTTTTIGVPLPDGVEPSANCQICNSSLVFAGQKAKEYTVGTQMYVLM